MAESVRAWAERILGDVAADEWTIETHGYEPVLEREIESRLSVGNGLLGVRGSLETPTLASRPRTLVAGLFDAVQGETGGPTLAPAPDWLRLAITVDGSELEFYGARPDHVRALDMKAGVLRSTWRHRLSAGPQIDVATLRLASLADRSTALQVVRIAAPAGSRMILESMLVPATLSLILEGIDGPASYWRTVESRRRLIIATNAQLFVDDAPLAPVDEGNRLARRWTWEGASGSAAVLIRTAAFAMDGDKGERTPATSAATNAARRSYRQIVDDHVAGWSDRWQASDVRLAAGDADQRALRYAVYQLTIAANPESERTSIGARGLTGDAYSGHVFWDTEIFLLPFYTFTWPEAARALLMYRFNTLPAARRKASRLGFRGALYAWESADTGDEVTPEYAHLPSGQTVPILSGTMEHHISADIAFAVWQYWQATGDTSFLRNAGAEILLETARFWASRASREADGRHHIRRVIGPDEYHEAIDDNAYTNLMAQWNLETGVAVARLVQSDWPDRWEELAAALGLSEDEVSSWETSARDMYTGLDQTTQLFEQFDGFFGLEHIDVAAYEPRDAAMDVLLGRERTQQSQVIKQADVVMVMALLWPRFTPQQRDVNFRYYESRCGHGSSLSPPVHALVAARLGDLTLARKYFQQGASIDLGDDSWNGSGGVHMATQGGLWQAAVFGFAGMSLSARGLAFNPHLPDGWRSLSFPVRYRGNTVRIEISPDAGRFEARAEDGATPVRIDVRGVEHTLRAGASLQWQLGHPSMEMEREGAR